MATIKQKRVIKEITENNRSVSAAMRKVGYKDSTATKPSNVTNSKAFREIMQEFGITDERLVKKLDEGLEANKVIVSPTEPDKEFPDFSTRHRYVTTSLKLRGHLESVPPTNTVIIPIYGGLSARPNEVRNIEEVPLSGYDSDQKDIPA